VNPVGRIIAGALLRHGGVFLSLLVLSASIASARTLRVGPERNYTTIRAAAQVAQNGDMILIDPGVYRADVARWTQDDLVLWAPNGRAQIRAEGRNEGGKGIWVVEGRNFTAENIEFSGARAPDHSGAGVRIHAMGKVTLRNCSFYGNENGVLGDADEIVIDRCVFDRNGAGDGRSHNIYVWGPSVTIRSSYIHRAVLGHNIKARGETNYILYNRIMDEDDGRSAFSIDVPDCGTTFLIGNVIEKGVRSKNRHVISYGGQSGKNDHNLYVVNNTLVNNGPAGGAFLICREGTEATVTNNIFLGPGKPWLGGNVSQSHNLIQPYLDTDLGFANPAAYDFRLTSARSFIVDRGISPGASVRAFDLTPRLEYVYDAQTKERAEVGALDLGAFELPRNEVEPEILPAAEPATTVQRARPPERPAKVTRPLKKKAKTYPVRSSKKKARRPPTSP
jgi:hypothetical protein